MIGGCGRVGLPLGLAFADRGLRVTLFDINPAAVADVAAGRLPFDEPGAAEVMARVVGHTLDATTDPACVALAEHVVIVVGTPVDEHLNPEPQAVPEAVAALAGQLRDGQLLVLRSTLYPGVTAMVERLVAGMGKDVDVAFCPERIAEGKAMTELFELPQLVAARTDRAMERSAKLFRTLTAQVVPLAPEEAELAKLFTNTWRYIRFAIANQLYMIANDYGLDFERIRGAMAHDYPRAADLPGAGFAAGPCLLKDTMQLAAFNNNNFTLGHAAMMVNEGLPLYVVHRLEQRFDLPAMTVGILGMGFKAESDDARDSLSYKLKRILRFKAAGVLTTDPHVRSDPDLLALDEVLERADVLVIGAPHQAYAGLKPRQPVIDIWDLYGNGVVV
ncbi:MAG: UDP-glucose/GDP-mannose dehydrogenase [uncultured Acidimicrobiales bacterium]|uniref:UDP-glucose/GDP-mannose dehydrogenase n=1 Tax=uncultured Acidimicrobiales bacterium TaxID=310071 RepID=A0A6J4IJA5_9ACTN|nr:MAG: UDP-glucose/GDP-mannose dehydrogenase [uncultured Acidimicrobiales bacterium]